MAVRFSPRDAEARPQRAERENLAEVIDLRTRLALREEEKVSDAQGSAESAGTAGDLAEVTELGPVSGTVRASSQSGVSPSKSLQAQVGESGGRAYEDGLRLLARKACSSGELRRALVNLGHPAPDVDAAILEFESSLYLDDLGLARVLVEKLRERKHLSRTQLRVKLRQRLIPDGVVEEALEDLDDAEESELLREAASDRARRLLGLNRVTAERRLLGFLARRGWSGDAALCAARDALDEVIDEQ